MLMLLFILMNPKKLDRIFGKSLQRQKVVTRAAAATPAAKK